MNAIKNLKRAIKYIRYGNLLEQWEKRFLFLLLIIGVYASL